MQWRGKEFQQWLCVMSSDVLCVAYCSIQSETCGESKACISNIPNSGWAETCDGDSGDLQ